MKESNIKQTYRKHYYSSLVVRNNLVGIPLFYVTTLARCPCSADHAGIPYSVSVHTLRPHRLTMQSTSVHVALPPTSQF